MLCYKRNPGTGERFLPFSSLMHVIVPRFFQLSSRVSVVICRCQRGFIPRSVIHHFLGGFFFLFFPISKYKNLTMDIKILFFAWETFWLDSLMIIFLTNNIFSKRNNLSWNNSFQILLDFSFLKYLKCACVFFFLIYLMRNKYFKF